MRIRDLPPHQWIRQSRPGQKVAGLVLYPVICGSCGEGRAVAQHCIDKGSGHCAGHPQTARNRTNLESLRNGGNTAGAPEK